MNDTISRYKIYIDNRYRDILNSGKTKDKFDNFDLAKIFEYYSCIKLTEEFNQIFYEYGDIDNNFKEQHHLTKRDTGIDCCNLIDTIVQCKLRNNSLSWKECSTFFGSNICLNDNNEIKTKWKKMIITRNKDSTLSDNLKCKKNLFLDKTYDKQHMLDYCEDLIKNKPNIKTINEKIEIRDYQKESINLIQNMKNNLIINLPTGTGKNFIIVHALKPKTFSYLILVPRIILLEQIETEILKYKPYYEKYIQKIGDGNNNYDEDKNITICVYNSVKLIDKYINNFDYIIVDEAHHIYIPEIYKIDNDDYVSDNNNSDSDNSDSDNNNSDSDNNNNSDSDNSDGDTIDNKTYLKLIKSYQKYKNNIYLSATIDKIDGFDYYTKDIREMIDKKYLCDYTITIPIFSDDPSNTDICKYLIKNYKNIIIYCNSKKEGIKINKLMNDIQKNCSAYIDCETKKIDRNKIITKYINGKLPFLVNIRILVEGFDAPITKGVCFMHMPSSNTTLIQIIGRALRLHIDKKFANIILPFSSKSEEGNINKFLKTMARNDSRIKESYINKKIGGYINIIDGKDNNMNDDDNDVENDIELKYELIYDMMGILKNLNEIWEQNLEKVMKYIEGNMKRPSNSDKNTTIKQLGSWIGTQQKNYKTKSNIMNNEEIYNKWTEFIIKYKEYFISNEEVWKQNLENVMKYIDDNNKRPSSTDKNTIIKKLGNWISTQQKRYKIKIRIMNNEEIYNKWTDFINSIKYKHYFKSNK